MAELAKKLADRWLDLLVLPGLLWLGALAAAIRLGQQHPFGISRLRDWLDHLAARPAAHSLAVVLLAAAGLLLASAAVGLAATALGGLLQRLWVLPGERRPLAWLVWARRRRWNRITTAAQRAITRAAAPAAYGQDPARARTRARRAERRRRALPGWPQRPTWIGDRFYATATRTTVAYGLNLDLSWPRLWTLLPDTLRGDLTTAQAAYTGATRLTAWGLLYATLFSAWWPAVLLGVAIFATGLARARSTASVLADLVETATDLHTGDLAAKLGVPASAPLTADVGRAITRILGQAHAANAGPTASHCGITS